MTEEPSAGKYLIRKITCIVILLVSISVPVFGQEKQKIPTNFLTGRWAGDIKGEFRSIDRKGKLAADGQSTIKIFNLLVEEYEGTEGEEKEEVAPIPGIPEDIQRRAAKIRNSFEGRAEFSGTNRFYDSRGRIGETWTLENNVEVINIYGHFLEGNRIYFSSENEVKVKRETFLGPFSEELLAFSIGGFAHRGPDGAKFEINEGNIFIDDEYKDSHTESIMKITGQLYRITKIRKNFPADIKPNEPIKTDKKTQLEITMPSKDVIKVAQNTEAVIRSESLMEVVKGKIHGLIKKLKPKTKFEIHTPTSLVAVRGTEYALNVEHDGTTTVVILDGEIEFSDKENKKMVIVKKNQKSVVKPGGLTTDPENIDPENILKWWK